MTQRVRNPAARRKAIQHEFLVSGTLSVTELSAHLGASVATIRRDLAALEEEGLVKRNYGGAVLTTESPAEQNFAVRQEQDRQAKRALAKAAVKKIKPGQTVFLSDGSTMLELAKEIAAANIKLFVATQAVNLAPVLAGGSNVTICLLGGFVRSTSFATCGPFAERMVEQINADWLFLSSSGFDPAVGLSYQDPNDVTLARAMLKQSRQTGALITQAKFSIHAPMTAVDVSDLDLLVTERLDPPARQILDESAVETIETDQK